VEERQRLNLAATESLLARRAPPPHLLLATRHIEAHVFRDDAPVRLTDAVDGLGTRVRAAAGRHIETEVLREIEHAAARVADVTAPRGLHLIEGGGQRRIIVGVLPAVEPREAQLVALVLDAASFERAHHVGDQRLPLRVCQGSPPPAPATRGTLVSVT